MYVYVRVCFRSGNLGSVSDVKELGLVFVRCEHVLNRAYLWLMMLQCSSVARDFAMIATCVDSDSTFQLTVGSIMELHCAQPQMSPVSPSSTDDLKDISMNALVERVLPFRSVNYVDTFVEKMREEGIVQPQDLLLASKEALETKLSSHASFNFIEMADAISLRTSIDRTEKVVDKKSTRQRSGSARRRNRSRSYDNMRSRGGDFDRRESYGFRRNSRPQRQRQDFYFHDKHPRPQRSRKQQQPKPELWAAVERNDELKVQELLWHGADPEETYAGWTPLMKAAEEGACQVMRMLLEKGVDIEAHNKKGRTALSFAAAPSNLSHGADGVRRTTPVDTLRLLLEHGADAKTRDERGTTPKEYAAKEKRDKATAVFEEFGL